MSPEPKEAIDPRQVEATEPRPTARSNPAQSRARGMSWHQSRRDTPVPVTTSQITPRPVMDAGCSPRNCEGQLRDLMHRWSGGHPAHTREWTRRLHHWEEMHQGVVQVEWERDTQTGRGTTTPTPPEGYEPSCQERQPHEVSTSRLPQGTPRVWAWADRHHPNGGKEGPP